MSKHRNDISQIRKYTSGELDARAMHRLERQALDDPFLADALEGYQNAGKNQQANLADITERLQSRVDEKVKRLIPWRPLSIAASILVVIGIGIWLMTNNANRADLKQVAANVKPVIKKEQPAISSPSTAASRRAADSVPRLAKAKKPKTYSQSEYIAADDKAAPPIVSELETNNASDANTVKLYSAQPRADTSLVAKRSPANFDANSGPLQANNLAANKIDLKPKNPDNANPLGNSNQAVVPAPGATYKSSPQTADAFKKAANNQPTLLQSKVDGIDVKPGNKSVAGTVTDLSGTPLAGAVVKVNGNNFGVVTDENGRFIIHDVPEKKNLTVGYLGYDTKQIPLNNGDSVNIALTPTQYDRKDLNAGSMASKRSSDAHPGAGWKAFDAYMGKNAILPDGQTGKVNLSFTVDAQGNLNNFTVVKSMNTAADQKAIDLVTKGPAWVGAADGQTHEVKLTVEFK